MSDQKPGKKSPGLAIHSLRADKGQPVAPSVAPAPVAPAPALAGLTRAGFIASGPRKLLMPNSQGVVTAEFTADAREFKPKEGEPRGNLGYGYYGKAIIDGRRYQVSLSMTLIGSKDIV